ncbi:Wadjet anti-phage system protein JetD domain-containing protein [Xanthomonas translucens pv. undulosa]|uniref:Wadjet anti-phage system protein JetD domain-containing protein n=1 Tax=Xanthomonas campestris pv. translucens TaxID=343 RepID=UPI003CED87E5
MFKNSKRIEGIEPWIDLAYAGDLAPSGLHPEDIRGALGLHHEPQAFFLHAEVEYWTRSLSVPAQPPYVGLPTRDIKGFRFIKQPQALLLIENKQSFHEFAAKAEHLPCSVVYTAGMPSPSWRRVMELLLEAVDPQVPVYHLGDIDLGGFRIAANIAKFIKATGRELRPWLMDPSELAAFGYELEITDESRNIPAMQRWCREAGWDAIADELAKTPGSVEQELIEARFPI